MGKDALPDPGQWITSVERIGIANTVVLILALGLAVSIVFRGPAYLHALNEIYKTFGKHRKDRQRIPTKVRDKQANLNEAIKARKRNGQGEAK
ncbi:hypothetical protein [Bradyrhizobium sp. AUGA SZCCT0431]|uniref:hypothetical protein n=1 Tax=Bradyrhizobium sp. AUGA SZCCT0431 TaxID=2807674 RepID=UPI001BADBA62|nr:hypothetical protein [Bradyrhizobium sp. AUGA SZCCT0431]MBR1142292.1 hypothetical protein [Bradyrhizobium sp. AUGA SZCCT0431]